VKTGRSNFAMFRDMILYILVEVVVTAVFFFILTMVLNHIFHITMTAFYMLCLLLVSLISSLVLVSLVFRRIYTPLNTLSNAMLQVARGNYKIRLDEHKGNREMKEISYGFNNMVDAMESSDRLKTEFISNVSHEAKTPLSVISGYTTLLQKEVEPGSYAAAYLDKINGGVNNVTNLFSTLLLLSKVDNQVLPVEGEEYLLDEQIRDVVIDRMDEIEKKEIDMDVQLDHAVYEGNEALIYHIWSNLLGNAIKFSPQKGKITIFLKDNSQGIRFSIEDEGPGISEEAIHHIYDQFYQGDSSHRSDGYGLGLSLVKKIVDICQGEIIVRNLPGHGCEFSVYLPKKQD